MFAYSGVSLPKSPEWEKVEDGSTFKYLENKYLRPLTKVNINNAKSFDNIFL